VCCVNCSKSYQKHEDLECHIYHTYIRSALLWPPRGIMKVGIYETDGLYIKESLD
jgi:hypothetical protein